MLLKCQLIVKCNTASHELAEDKVSKQYILIFKARERTAEDFRVIHFKARGRTAEDFRVIQLKFPAPKRKRFRFT